MNVIFTCGGTGGHINPAIAVAHVLQERCPGCNILFVGAQGGMEEELVPKAGFDIKLLPASSFSRKLTPKGLWHNLLGVGKIGSALLGVRKLLREFRPDVVVGTGGYASFPALKVASMMGIPTCVHEANAVPGLATRLVAKKADQILVCFDECRKGYPNPEKIQVVGMPIRREFIYTKRADARKALGLDERPFIVSAFGSLGAREMNKAMADFLKLETLEGCPYQHIHATGSFGWKWMPQLMEEKGVDFAKTPGVSIREYIYNMPTLMAAADLVISRAGASSCNEIAAVGTPCILIPSPNVTDNHQEKNARVLETLGGCAVVLESQCSGQKLYDEAKAILADPVRQKSMRQALLQAAVPDSAERICDIVLQLARR